MSGFLIFFLWIYLFPPLKDVVLLHPSHQLLLPDKSSLGRDAIYFCPMLHKMKMVLMHITKSWTGFHLAPTLFSQFNIVSKGWVGTQIHHSSLTWRSKHWGLARSCSCPGEDRSLLQDFLSANSFTIIHFSCSPQHRPVKYILQLAKHFKFKFTVSFQKLWKSLFQHSQSRISWVLFPFPIKKSIQRKISLLNVNQLK